MYGIYQGTPATGGDYEDNDVEYGDDGTIFVPQQLNRQQMSQNTANLMSSGAAVASTAHPGRSENACSNGPPVVVQPSANVGLPTAMAPASTQPELSSVGEAAAATHNNNNTKSRKYIWLGIATVAIVLIAIVAAVVASSNSRNQDTSGTVTFTGAAAGDETTVESPSPTTIALTNESPIDTVAPTLSPVTSSPTNSPTAAPIQTCEQAYGSNVLVCEEKSDECTFFAKLDKDKNCRRFCEARGGTCLRAQEDEGNSCKSHGDISCDEEKEDNLCTCTLGSSTQQEDSPPSTILEPTLTPQDPTPPPMVNPPPPPPDTTNPPSREPTPDDTVGSEPEPEPAPTSPPPVTLQTPKPTRSPEADATPEPTVQPTVQPTAQPTANPTEPPTRYPTRRPTERPTPQPQAPTLSSDCIGCCAADPFTCPCTAFCISECGGCPCSPGYADENPYC